MISRTDCRLLVGGALLGGLMGLLMAVTASADCPKGCRNLKFNDGTNTHHCYMLEKKEEEKRAVCYCMNQEWCDSMKVGVGCYANVLTGGSCEEDGTFPPLCQCTCVATCLTPAGAWPQEAQTKTMCEEYADQYPFAICKGS